MFLLDTYEKKRFILMEQVDLFGGRPVFFSCIAVNTGQSDLFLDTYENNKVYCQSRGGMRYGKNPKCISWTVGWADCCN